jgi:MFS family permease
MSLLDRPEVQQQRRRVTAGVATLDGISDRFAQFMQRYNVHYGWAVAIATFLTMLATAGVLGSAGVMIEPLQAEFGWSNADISFALAVRLLLFGLMGPFSAAFMNRFGIRNVVIAALVLISSGLLGSFFMTQTWQLVLLWGVVVGFGTGMTVLALVAVALLMRDHPDEVGLAPYGGTERVTAPPRQLGIRQLLLSPLVALREASKTAAFWALFFTFYVCGLSTNGLIQTH